MEKRWIITKREAQILSCYFEGDSLLTVQCEEDSKTLVGNIYLGKIQSVIKNMNAAFVEIEKGVNCYLSLAEVKEPCLCNRAYDGRFLQGDEVLVQVIRDRIKTKDAVVSTNLSFSGRYSVVTTENKQIGYSAKLTKRQKELLEVKCAPFLGSEFGYILRTNAGEMVASDPSLITKELDAMTQKAQTLLSIAKTRTVFSCLLENSPSYLLKIRDCDRTAIDRIITDDSVIYEQICSYLLEHKLESELLSKVSFYQDSSYSLSKLVRLEKHLTDALNKKVWLPCGGYLIIEQTEALTVIDVNSGKCVSKKAKEENFYKINEEAALEIAHQLRVRNLSGIIIIDFINMKQKDYQLQLMDLLKRTCKKDVIQTNVIDMTPLGLVEVTRKRVYKTLKEQLVSMETFSVKES